MAKVLSVAIQKGGCAKTTTTITLGSCLADKGYRVLLIDIDPQGNLSYGCGVEDATYTIFEALKEEYDEVKGREGISKAIIHKPENCDFDVVPTNILLAGAEGSFTSVKRPFLLKNLLKPIQDDYDFIIIDCPPSLGVHTLNAFTASDGIIIPIEPSYFAVQGLEQLNDTINNVREYCNNPNLKVLGILITRYAKRRNLIDVAIKSIGDKASEFGIGMFETKISEAVVVKESQALQIPLIKHSPGCSAIEQYNQFTEEILKGVE